MVVTVLRGRWCAVLIGAGRAASPPISLAPAPASPACAARPIPSRLTAPAPRLAPAPPADASRLAMPRARPARARPRFARLAPASPACRRSRISPRPLGCVPPRSGALRRLAPAPRSARPSPTPRRPPPRSRRPRAHPASPCRARPAPARASRARFPRRLLAPRAARPPHASPPARAAARASPARVSRARLLRRPLAHPASLRCAPYPARACASRAPHPAHRLPALPRRAVPRRALSGPVAFPPAPSAPCRPGVVRVSFCCWQHFAIAGTCWCYVLCCCCVLGWVRSVVEREAGVQGLVFPGFSDPVVDWVVGYLPCSFLAWPCHDVQVVQVVAWGGH